jgi:hypothetical protein
MEPVPARAASTPWSVGRCNVADVGVSLIPCVIYAAKSTEDRRGSIPGQLRECREAIEGAGPA